VTRLGLDQGTRGESATRHAEGAQRRYPPGNGGGACNEPFPLVSTTSLFTCQGKPWCLTRYVTVTTETVLATPYRLFERSLIHHDQSSLSNWQIVHRRCIRMESEKWHS
jgi:hypothetical protein